MSSFICMKKWVAMTDFSGIRDFINISCDCLLSYLSCIGEQMTWINDKRNDNLIMERLDRVIYLME